MKIKKTKIKNEKINENMQKKINENKKWKLAEKINEKNIRKFKMKIAGRRHNKMKILDYFDGFSTMKNTGHPFWAGEIDEKNFLGRGWHGQLYGICNSVAIKYHNCQ